MTNDKCARNSDSLRDNNSYAGRGQLFSSPPSSSILLSLFCCISHGPAIERLVAVTQAAGWSVARWNERPFLRRISLAAQPGLGAPSFHQRGPLARVRHSLAPRWNHDAGLQLLGLGVLGGLWDGDGWVGGSSFSPLCFLFASPPCLAAHSFASASRHRHETRTRPEGRQPTTRWEPRFSRPFPRKSASGCGGGLGLLGFFFVARLRWSRPCHLYQYRALFFLVRSPLLLSSSPLLSSPLCSLILPTLCVR